MAQQDFKNQIIIYREQVMELGRLCITTAIAHLQTAVVPMGEVLRSGQLQKHLPPSIVQECDIRGTRTMLKAVQVWLVVVGLWLWLCVLAAIRHTF